MPSGYSRTCARCAAPRRHSINNTGHAPRCATSSSTPIGLHAQEIEAGEDRRVTISTIHRAKGTEARLVILLGCEEQLLPSWQSLASPDPEALCEERRLFYVAATRAKDRLILTHVRTRGGRDTGGPPASSTRRGC